MWLKHSTANHKVAGLNPSILLSSTLNNFVGVFLKALSPEVVYTASFGRHQSWDTG